MSAIPLIVEVTSLFLIVLVLLHRYANFKEQNRIILIATFIAWYFSFMIVILLPMDISMTTYRQCLQDTPIIIENSTSTNETVPITKCKEPWSLISPKFFPVLWRIIYWTSQALTWLILPFMQSFCQSGEFSLTGKIKGALIANAIYYGSYLALFGFLLIYVAIEHNIDGPKLKVIGITASNTWGLFLLVLLLGYGLVAVPRSIWSKSNTSLRLKQIYFKLAKLHGEKCEAEEQLEDILNEIKIIAEKIRYNHPFRSFVDIIVTKCPESFRNNLRRNVEDYSEYNESAYDRDIPSEKALVKLHCSLIKALQVKDRTSNEWYLEVEEAFKVEDILLNETNSNHKYMKTMPFKRCSLMDKFCNPTFEWFYYCIVQKYFLRLVSIVLAILTIMVIWSEMTFFNKKPVLSLFAIFLNASRSTYNYISIEFIVCLTIAYLCFCAYYAIFKMRIFNYYYLASNHHTSENSLIFSGTLVCRLTSPLCYNFLGLVHLDSHITKDTDIVETQFTSIMGHMDVISVISDGFNIYFPILILFLCLANFFNLGGHILHFFGFEQFIGDEEVTQDLIEDGKNLVKREKRRIQRNDPEVQTRHREVVDRLRNNYSTTSIRSSSNLLTSTASREIDLNKPNGSGFNFNDKIKNIIPSSLPNFLSSRLKEYRDIPPYTDIPTDDETGAINSSNIPRNDEYTNGFRYDPFEDNYKILILEYTKKRKHFVLNVMQSIPLPNETQLAEEYNRLSSFELCITSQELIQELILKSSELVNTFRSITLNLIYSDQNTYLARKAKTEDLLKNFDLIFLRLRIISKLLHQRKQNKLIEESSQNNETHDKLEIYKFEKDRLIGQIRDKNKYIKEAIDRVSNIIWQINSIQTLKH